MLACSRQRSIDATCYGVLRMVASASCRGRISQPAEIQVESGCRNAIITACSLPARTRLPQLATSFISTSPPRSSLAGNTAAAPDSGPVDIAAMPAATSADASAGGAFMAAGDCSRSSPLTSSLLPPLGCETSTRITFFKSSSLPDSYIHAQIVTCRAVKPWQPKPGKASMQARALVRSSDSPPSLACHIRQTDVHAVL